MRALKKSDLKLTMREQARRKVHPPGGNIGTDRKYRESVEGGRKELDRVANEGGDPHAKKVKAELTYLLNNYLPSYDMRIEHLIDEWRRSGDPSYDPSIRTKLRQSRRDYTGKTTAV
jgi:hypothetical protein